MNAIEAFVFGEWITQPEGATNWVFEIVHQARRRKNFLRAVPANHLCEVIGALGPLWSKGGKYHKEFLQRAPWKSLGLSRRMVEIGLDHFARCLDSNIARQRIQTQLSGMAYLDSFMPYENLMLRAEPLGVVLHVVSENVFFGPAQSLLVGFLTKNINIVKRPSGGGDFLTLFVHSFEEIAPKEVASVALIGWQSGNQEIEEFFSNEVDGILLAAGPDTIAAYRRRTPPATELIEFGPRVSIAVISAEGMQSLDYHGLALDVALWDQLACTAAQCIYVESWEAARVAAGRLASALERLEFEIPEGEPVLDERIEVARLRETACFRQVDGETSVLTSRQGGTWTVVCEKDPIFRFSPLRRCVRVKPYADFDDLREALRPTRGLLQTAGLAVGESEQASYEECLASCGMRRICNIGRMNEPPSAGLHDGIMELQRLVRWVEREKTG
jgi:phenylacetate-CoA ligase